MHQSVAAVIRPYRRRRKEVTLRRIIAAYNDEHRRSFAEIAAIIAEAKALAEADAGQPPRDDRQARAMQAGCSAVTAQFDRFQAQVVRELGRNYFPLPRRMP
jgi:hypothetical protein